MSDKLEKVIAQRYTKDGVPIPTQPPHFEPDPIMPANREHAKAVYEFLQAYPKLRGKTPRIVSGPSTGSINLMRKNNIPIDAFENTNLAGVFHVPTKEIGLSPDLKDKEDFYFSGTDMYKNPSVHEVIAHEFGHADGKISEESADEFAMEYIRKRNAKQKLQHEMLRRSLITSMDDIKRK